MCQSEFGHKKSALGSKHADLHMAQLMQLPFTISCSSKSRLVLPFWYWLTQVDLDKIQKSRKTTVVVMTKFCDKIVVFSSTSVTPINQYAARNFRHDVRVCYHTAIPLLFTQVINIYHKR